MKANTRLTFRDCQGAALNGTAIPVGDGQKDDAELGSAALFSTSRYVLGLGYTIATRARVDLRRNGEAIRTNIRLRDVAHRDLQAPILARFN